MQQKGAEGKKHERSAGREKYYSRQILPKLHLSKSLLNSLVKVYQAKAAT